MSKKSSRSSRKEFFVVVNQGQAAEIEDALLVGTRQTPVSDVFYDTVVNSEAGDGFVALGYSSEENARKVGAFVGVSGVTAVPVNLPHIEVNALLFGQ